MNTPISDEARKLTFEYVGAQTWALLNDEQKYLACLPAQLAINSALAEKDKEIEELKKWKEEDPRMLREQIRVADVAFNHQAERIIELEKQLFNLRNDCGICVCPPNCHDEMCASCITDKPYFKEEIAELQKQIVALREANETIGKWLSAALDDPSTCFEMKRDVRAWFEALTAARKELQPSSICKCGGKLIYSPCSVRCNRVTFENGAIAKDSPCDFAIITG